MLVNKSISESLAFRRIGYLFWLALVWDLRDPIECVSVSRLFERFFIHAEN